MDREQILEVIEVGEWKGLPRYQCKLCPFDSLHRDVVVAHVLARHFPAQPRPGQAGTPLLLDRYGNPVLTAAPGVEVRSEEERPAPPAPRRTRRQIEEVNHGENDADAG